MITSLRLSPGPRPAADRAIKSTQASDTGIQVQYEFESPNIILIRRQAFPAA